jgi:hypothetical protein
MGRGKKTQEALKPLGTEEVKRLDALMSKKREGKLLATELPEYVALMKRELGAESTASGASTFKAQNQPKFYIQDDKMHYLNKNSTQEQVELAVKQKSVHLTEKKQVNHAKTLDRFAANLVEVIETHQGFKTEMERIIANGNHAFSQFTVLGSTSRAIQAAPSGFSLVDEDAG